EQRHERAGKEGGDGRAEPPIAHKEEEDHETVADEELFERGLPKLCVDVVQELLLVKEVHACDRRQGGLKGFWIPNALEIGDDRRIASEFDEQRTHEVGQRRGGEVLEGKGWRRLVREGCRKPSEGARAEPLGGEGVYHARREPGIRQEGRAIFALQLL